MEKPLMLAVRGVYRTWSSLLRAMAQKAGVPDSYRMVLLSLLRHPGLSQKELAERGGVSCASVSQTVREMQLTGYLKKESDARDQRCVQLYLTEKGIACAGEIHEMIHSANRRISQQLSRGQEAQALALLQALGQILEKELAASCCDT